MAFPVSPTNGQVTVVNQVSYQYSSATNSWTRILSTANVITANTIAVNGALTVGTTISATGNISVAAGNFFVGNGSQLTGVTASSAGFPISSGNSNIAATANANIFISVGGTANVAVFATTGEYITGVLSASGTITGGNLETGGTASAAGNVTGGNVLTGGLVSATANVTGGNLLTGGLISATSNVRGGNILTAGLISATGNATVGNVLTAGDIVNAPANTLISMGTGSGIVGITTAANTTQFLPGGQVTLGGASRIQGGTFTGSYITLGTSQTDLAQDRGGNVTVQLGTGGTIANTWTFAQSGALLAPGAVSAVGNVTGGNVLTAGLVSATGNVTGNYILGNGALLTGVITSVANINNGTSNVTVVSSGGNVTVGVGGTGNVAVFATTGEYITGELSANGNVTGGNLLTGGLISATSTITSTANITGGNLLTSGLISATANVTGGNVLSGDLISAAGNITGAGIFSGSFVSATGNVTSGNLRTVGLISATGNVTGGNLLSSVVYSATNLTITAASGNITLNPSANVLMSSRNINNLADPVQDQDAATKVYVDNIAQGLDPKASVVYATTANLAPYTYNNGTSGVGATITITATGNLTIDGSVVSVNERVLIKNEVSGNAPYNGIYVVSTAGAPGVAAILTRSADMNIWAEVPGAFTFVEAGAVNLDTGWVSTADATGTMGTTAITWTQFSAAGSYTANTSAGLSLIGSQFNAKVDGVTTAFDGGGNISVKASANLTTPNIGAATGTSLSVTGALNAGAAASVAGNITGGNLLTGGLITATGNITGGNILTGGLVSATGNATFGNISTSGASGNISGANVISGTTLSASGNVIGGNVTTGGLISATSTITSAANITGGNLVSSGQISASGNVNIGTNYYFGNGSQLTGIITSVANINNGTSNVSIAAANANVTVSVNGTSNVAVFATTGEYITGELSASGNVTGGNVLTAGLISATSTITSAANITGGNVLTGGLISATANVTGGNLLTAGIISATGNIRGGNVSATNYYYANGIAIVNYTASTTPPASPTTGWQWYNTSTDVLYEYITDGTTPYWVDISSPAFAGGVVANVSIAGSMLVNANAVYDIGSSSQTFANVYAQNYYGNGATLTGIITSVSNINNGTSNVTVNGSGGNITTSVGGTANVGVFYNGGLSITGDLAVTGNATLSGNILGDRIQNGTTQIDIQTPNGNANITVGGTSNVAVFATTGAFVTGVNSVTGNITGGNILTAGLISATGTITGSSHLGAVVSVTANVTGGNVLTGGLISSTGTITGSSHLGAVVSVTGNITGGNLILSGAITDSGQLDITTTASNGNIVLTPNGTGNINISSNVMPTSSNATANIGSSTSSWNTVFAKSTSAQYADLAENYLADAVYVPGTVLDFDGAQEVTLSTRDSSRRVAGVVSTNPAHLMNSTLDGAHVVAVALVGRVPTQVTGTVAKGDLMVSAGNGRARAEANPSTGTVIGKALENFDGGEGTIEIVISMQ